MTQSVMLFARRKKLAICPESRTIAGFWVIDTPIDLLYLSSNHSEIAIAILKSLERSRLEVTTPDRNSNVFTPVLEAFGVSSYSTFMKGATGFRITRNTGKIEFVPLVNEGARQGFSFLESQSFTVNDSHESITIAVGQMLDALLRPSPTP